MNILLLGSGGREHALAWKIKQSRHVKELYIAPGNAGTGSCGINVDIAVHDFPAIAALTLEKKIDMVVVGPEDPLVNGIFNYFQEDPAVKQIAVIGPSAQGAQLEGSKDFAKEFMKRNHIPTAAYFSVVAENLNEGLDFLGSLQPPYVLKADGLAAGKGVLIMADLEEARNELRQMLNGKFGEASKKVVIEECLRGIELSAFIITDGIHYKMLPEAKDYKRIGEGDTGMNTGGMGAVSPVPFASKEFMQKVEDRIIKPTIEGIRKENISYQGFIFFGLMNCHGDPYVIEYNVRLGDPETEVILPRLKGDIMDLFIAVAEKKLDRISVEIDSRTAVTVIMASGGYPGHYEKGKIIDHLDKTSGSLVFHAGTKREGDQILTNGGRVLAISSLNRDFRQALKVSYDNAALIEFDKKYYRTDIGFDL